jgi:squalene synthase HpnC
MTSTFARRSRRLAFPARQRVDGIVPIPDHRGMALDESLLCRPAQPPSLAEAEAYCRRLATTHYENFPLASWLLPRALRQHFYNVYAYCRMADDLGDETGDAARSLELLAGWRRELEQCYAGEPRHPVFVALRTTIVEFQIPADPFRDLISAFEQDQRLTEYDTFAELRNYCRRSADPVGRIVLHLCRQYTEQHAAWSDSICTGLQLANFWQDVARDYALGRIYLPREDRERFGVRREDFDRRQTTPEFRALLQFEVERARDWLRAGLPLVDRMPGRLQVDIDLFARGGLKILDRIERIDYCVWETRPKVTPGDVLGLSLCALYRAAGRWARRRFASSPPQPVSERP